MSVLLHRNEGPGLWESQPVPVDYLMPAKDRWVLVFTRAYRCLGYHENGVWHHVAHHQLITERVFSWMPLDKPLA